MPRYVIAQQEGEESEPESSEDEQEEEVEEVDDGQEQRAAGVDTPAGVPDSRGKISIALKKGSGGDVCHVSYCLDHLRGACNKRRNQTVCLWHRAEHMVCGKPGHTAGFINGGSVYLDCPNKPCYLCKQPGHTTMTCPHRIAPDHGCVRASAAEHNLLGSLVNRERDGRRREMPVQEQRWQVEAAVLKLHERRCTCLEFHPTKDSIVLSGDKKGQVAIWDFEQVYERTVYKFNHALTNNIRFLPGGDGTKACTSSSCGFVRVFDIETGDSDVKLNMNPGGWVPGVTKEKDWGMVHGMDVNMAANIICAGDTLGRLNFIDPREPKPFAQPQLHKKDKIVSVHVNPADSNLLLTASNDHTARIHDIRCLSSRGASGSNGEGHQPEPVAVMEHPKVVNSAFFSPISGSKILTTCIDNRLRVWDNLYAANEPASREVVHSHDFNRYLTPFRAEWDPKDPYERVAVIGRYISEDFDGVALHPVDIQDTSTGRLLAQLIDPNLTTICPVNKPHPRRDVIISGSSKSLYAWKPKPADPEEEKQRLAAAESRREETGSLRLDGIGQFLFFDADDTATEKKKRKAAADADGGKGGKKK